MPATAHTCVEKPLRMPPAGPRRIVRAPHSPRSAPSRYRQGVKWQKSAWKPLPRRSYYAHGGTDEEYRETWGRERPPWKVDATVNGDTIDAPEWLRDDYRRMARAAIAAMGNP